MQTVASLVVAVLLIGFITFRQTRWQPVRLAKLLRMPIIFAAIGLLLMAQATHQLPAGWHLDALDAVIIAFELVIALIIGWWMGRLTQIQTIDGVVSSRLTRPGVAVWLGFVALRIGLGIAASALSAPLAALPATVLFVVAAIKIVQAVVIRERVARHQAGEQQNARPYVGAELR